jgi:hypothetical protein
VTASATTRTGVTSIFHAVVASSRNEPSELIAKASQVLPNENVLITGLPIATGPVLNQPPSGFHAVVAHYAPRRIADR